MLALLQTLFDIIRLRKGPDALPPSSFLFVLAVALWLAAGAVMTVLTETLDARGFFIGTLTGIAGLGCYATVVTLSGRAARLLQTTTAILGCGALLGLVFTAGEVLLPPLLGAATANVIVTLVLLWSIPVEGHIIARAIDQHWFLGVAIAFAVFIFQLLLHGLIDPMVAA